MSQTSFLTTAVAAFPGFLRASATQAADWLAPSIDESYRLRFQEVVVFGRAVQIPKRIHFIGPNDGDSSVGSEPWLAIQCLRTRSTDGYMRQASLRRILTINQAWTIPFVVLLSGEYVVEIVEDMVACLAALDRSAYINFVRENRPLMRVLRSRATSYWDCYYRARYTDRSIYPGLAFLHHLESWAS